MDYISMVIIKFMVDNAGYEEISSDEETIPNEQFHKLLLQLEKDLKKLKDDSDEELNEHFEELKKLNKTATLSVINIEDVTNFLETAIFTLMIELPEIFSFKPLTIYKSMLECVKSFPKAAYLEHLQVLLDIKNDETKDLLLLIKKEKQEKKPQSFSLLAENEQQFSVVRPFFSILSEEKAKKRANLEDVEILPKPKRLRGISPLAIS